MQTTIFNFADRNVIRMQVAKTMTEYDPTLLETLTDKEMKQYDFESYVV